LGELWATDTALEQEKSGSTMWLVLDQRLTLATVVTVAGAHTTADITRTFLLHVIAACLLMVSDYFFVLLGYHFVLCGRYYHLRKNVLYYD